MAALAASYKSNLSAPVVAPKTVAPPSSKCLSFQNYFLNYSHGALAVSGFDSVLTKCLKVKLALLSN